MTYDELLEEYNAWTDVIEALDRANARNSYSFICTEINELVFQLRINNFISSSMKTRLKKFAAVEFVDGVLWDWEDAGVEPDMLKNNIEEAHFKMCTPRIMACQLIQFEIEKEMKNALRRKAP